MKRKNFNVKSVERQCTSFIQRNIARADADGVVIGLSGGLDSAVVAALCVKALGWEMVHGVSMPYYKPEPGDSFNRANDLANKLGITLSSVFIAPLVDFFGAIDKVRLGNIMARMRMTIQYDIAKRDNYLVAGTENKSEWLMGYFTQHGDSACDFSPIADLYKTEVRWLAEHLGIPQEILDAAPSAGLWEGQTDEKEMGVTYEQIDEYFYRVFNTREETRDIRADTDAHILELIESRHAATYFKRTATPVCFINRGKLK